ncbi:MAG: hypothetical protein ACJ76I_13950 [Gaiellaceae bacterium]
MRARSLIVALVTLTVASVVAVTTAQSSVPMRPLITGLVQPTAFPLDPSDRPAAYRRIAQAGGTVVRIGLSWRATASHRPAKATNPDDPAYDWTAFDADLSAAVGAGLIPIVSINDTPSWARSAPSGENFQPNVASFGSFASAAATRYDGRHRGVPRIKDWQAWIEPNVNSFLAPQYDSQNKPVSPEYYRLMVNAFAASVHAARPDNLVVAGGLSPFTVQVGDTRTVGPLRFMRMMLCLSSGPHPKPTCHRPVHFDVWSHHPYTTGNAQHHAVNPDDVSLGDLPKMKKLLDAAQAAGDLVSSHPIRFWVTEFSWDTDPPDPHAVPVALQARWTAEALYTMWSAGIDLVIWLQLRDEPYPQSPNQGGLYFRGASFARDRPKPTLTAFRFPFVAYLDKTGVRLWGRTPTSTAGTVTIEHRVGSGSPWRHFVTLHANRFGIFGATVASALSPKESVRVRAPGSASLAFSLTEPPDHPYHPFG